jgi:carboxypeptidase Q
MKSRYFMGGILALALGWGIAQPLVHARQGGAVAIDPLVERDRQIEAEIKNNNELASNLEYLSDVIGPRLTGSVNLDQASHWTQKRFTDYGLSNVHLEPWNVTHSWARGTAQARILSPMAHPITIASAAWAPNTNGAISGPVVYMKVDKIEDLEQYRGKVKGAVVITSAPFDFNAPENPMLTPYGDEIVPINLPKKASGPRNNPRLYQAVFAFLKHEGVAAALLSSDKPYGLLNMFGIGGPMYFEGQTPLAIIGWEDYNLIWRLMKKGPVQLEVNIAGNAFSEQPVQVYNTVAEIKGSSKPDEVVIIGAHLDSWDLGTGATDNGTGSAAVMEAARALAKSGLEPRRTIRFILFTGEEQGLCGSHAYVTAHKDEMGKISGVLVHDTGTSRVISIGMMGFFEDREVMEKVVAPMKDLGLLEPSLRSLNGSDHNSFDAVGVPGFWAIQDVGDYPKTHHSQADTFDRVKPDELMQGAQVLATWAYNVAQLPEMLPRKKATADAAAPVGPPVRK